VPFNNLDYQYNSLPARHRVADGSGLLKRFLTFFGEQLDKFDQDFETFHEMIKAATAPEVFIDYWCWTFFGWGWFPSWYTLGQKRAFYADLAKHLARRGTKKGIEGFLAAFGIHARVFNQDWHWEEFSWGEEAWATTAPLAFVIQIFPLRDVAAGERDHWEEFFWDDAYFGPDDGVIGHADLEALLRFQLPLSQDIYIEYLTV
jgi:phage tail-like protein